MGTTDITNSFNVILYAFCMFNQVYIMDKFLKLKLHLQNVDVAKLPSKSLLQFP